MPGSQAAFGDVIRKAITRARSRGAAEVARELRNRLVRAVRSENSLIVMARATSEDREEAPLQLIEATPAHAGQYARDIGTDAPSTFRARLSPTTTCWLVLSGNRIIHATWASFGATWIGELGRYFCPPPAHGYLYESFTAPDQRGQGIYPAALRGIAARLHARGITRVWIAATADNVASLRAISKAGFETEFRIPYRRRAARIQVDVPPGAQHLIGPKCLG